jgi:hypothetical protein
MADRRGAARTPERNPLMPPEIVGTEGRRDPDAGAEPARQWPLRLAGCLFGLGSCLFGLFSLLGGGPDLPELNRERAQGLGIAATVIGLVAIGGSLLMQDVHRLWYCRPRRWRTFRDRR